MKYSKFTTSTVLNIAHLILIIGIKESASLAFQSTRTNYKLRSTPLFATPQTINTDNNDRETNINKDDAYFMRRALSHASKGYGKTYPNPAVGCVIIQQHNKQIIGEGFHPKAGMPHAEVFALFQASGLVPDGVAAAMNGNGINELVTKYCTENGPYELFNECCSEVKCTAYVTLEPCCHYGKTPPCAASLKLAGVDRVVVGYPDINPKVNGGGVKLLQDAGVQVDFIDTELRDDCHNMIEHFLNRISTSTINYDSLVDSGKKRRLLRSIAGRRKNDQTLLELSISVPMENGWLPSPMWLEEADAILWKEELLLLRIGTLSSEKKRDVVVNFGNVIAHELNAYVAQKLGHTILLYRPSKEPIIDLEQ